VQFVFPWSEPDLLRWLGRPIHPQAPRESVPDPYHDLTEATLAMESEGPPEENGSFARVSESILGYRVFGPKIGTPHAFTHKVTKGETIGLSYRFLPGLSLFFASRVVEVFEYQETPDGWRSGFVYQTLTQHPELGEEIFEVSKRRDGTVTFRLEAWSRPNLWYVKLFTPLGRRIQKYAARCAVEYLTEVAAS
jgi:Domain of unknown function (DUF1990)